MESVRDYAEKVHFVNRRKKAVRNYLAALRNFKVRVLSAAHKKGVDLCRGDKQDRETLGKLFEEHAHYYEVEKIDYSLCIPNRVPSMEVENLDSLDEEIARWEDQLDMVGGDAQLAQVDLQNWMQKVQQSLTMLSNLSKTLHDVSMMVIRNIKS